MTTTAFDDQFTAAPEPVREPYDTVAILRRNVAALEVALRTQTGLKEKAEEKLTTARDDMQSWIDSRNGWMERAEKTEAELAKLREQKPVAWRHENGNIFLPWQKDMIVTGAVFSPLFAAPVPAPHPGATHCSDCGLTWLDDGLNPLGCPYCKTHASERNARRYLALRKVGVQVPGYDFVKFDWSLDAAADRLLEGGE